MVDSNNNHPQAEGTNRNMLPVIIRRYEVAEIHQEGIESDASDLLPGRYESTSTAEEANHDYSHLQH